MLVTTFSLFGSEKKAAPCGSWPSPISAKLEGDNYLRLSEAKLSNGVVYWLEGRPKEGGRVALMSWTKEGGEKELLPKTFSVRNRVNEYGGGALMVGKTKIYFVNDKDQQVYERSPNGEVRQITNKANARFADGSENPIDGTLYYVMEEHGKEVVNTIVCIDPATGAVKPLLSGSDFYSNPRISPDGKQLAYITWNQPNMPWDGTELWALTLKSKEQKKIAGGPAESVAAPKWSADGALYFVSDKSNWWNLYAEGKKIDAVEGEFIYPQWVFGTSWVEFCDRGMFATYAKLGANRFSLLAREGKWEAIDLPYTGVLTMSGENDEIVMIATSEAMPLTVLHYDLKSRKVTPIKSSFSHAIEPNYISLPESIEFKTTGGKTAYAFYYPPCSPKYQPGPSEKPPLLVMSHGGPTAHLTPSFNSNILFWTSRGFAIAVVNYGGSTGYGREYRERLNDNWGIVDVDDCCNAALHLANKGLVDPERLAIEGASAGGYTTLAALAFRDVFRVGADYFGVSDLVGLATFTHKFEARYLDQLVGPYPERKDLYIERSPLYHADKIKRPVILLQGAEDAVVPPAQSEVMYNSLLSRKIPTAYLLFKGEQHGFRRAENIARSLEAQLYFFSKVLGFPLGEKIEPVEIMNLP